METLPTDQAESKPGKGESESNKSMEVMGTKSDILFIKICFIFFGIGTLLVFNFIISDIDFFIHFQGTDSKNPSIVFPFLNFILNILFQFIMVCKKKMFSYKAQLIFSIIFQICSLVLIPVSVLCFPRKEVSEVSFYITCVIVFLQGFATAVCTSSFMGLASYFPVGNIVALSIGQGLAGILSNILKYLTLIFLPVSDSTKDEWNLILGSLIFFSVGCVLMILCFIFLMLAYRNEYFLQVLEKVGEIGNVEIVPTTQIEEEMPDPTRLVPKDLDETQRESYRDSTVARKELEEFEIKIEDEKYKRHSFIYLIKCLLDINILIFVAYFVTFSVYPGACLEPSLFGLNMFWKPNTVITIFNIFDTIGRKIVDCLKPKKWMLYVSTLIRLILLILIPLDDYLEFKQYITASSALLIFNVVFLSLTNGIATSLAYALAPMSVKSYLKGKAGGSVSFFNICGIFIGTISAFGMNAIIKAITK